MLKSKLKCSFCSEPSYLSNLGLNFCPFNICLYQKCWNKLLKPSKKLVKQSLKLANQLFSQHNLSQWTCQINTINPKKSDWVGELHSNIYTAGLCYFSAKQIVVSSWVIALNQPEALKQILLHEISHALVGSQHQHDQVWRRKAKKIGYLYGARGQIPKKVAI